MAMKNSRIDSKLTASYKNRKDGMKKKAKELSVLCGVPTCVMVIGPDGDTDSWPENPNDVRSILQKYRVCKNNKKRKYRVCKNNKKGGAVVEISNGREGLSKEVLETLLCDVEKKLKEVNDRIEVVNFMNAGLQNNVAIAQPSFTDMLNYGFYPTEMFNWEISQYQTLGHDALMWQNNDDNRVASSSIVTMSNGYYPIMEKKEEMPDLGLGQYQSFDDHVLMLQKNNDNGVGSTSIVTTNDGYFPVMETKEETVDWAIDQYQSFGEDALLWNMEDFKTVGLQF